MSASLLVGRVMHVRHAPFRHRFDYRMWMLSLDLDTLDVWRSKVFRHNRPGLVSLQDRDHGPRDGTELRPWVTATLRAHDLQAFDHRVDFVFIPRVLGFAFNPIAFYLCRDAGGKLGAVIHQVKNTFGDQTAYVLPADESRVVRQSAAKTMMVSPFFDSAGGYRFALTPSDPDGFSISIRYGTEDAPRLTATMRLKRRAATDAALARLLLAMPLMPLKVFAAIHWEALILWLRGARLHPITPPVRSMSGRNIEWRPPA
jgi:DUF1365 family protein